ncbi:hypothetical protein PFISCL1PPCAC_26635, partial [Pristionchus fissidentatus]
MLLFVTFFALFATITGTAHYPKRFTDHFVKFLMNNPHRNKFALNSYVVNEEAGTFGGRTDVDDDKHVLQNIRHDPVVFVHGNQESALYHSPTATGWNKQIEHFLGAGYSMVEMYGLTHGHRNVAVALANRFTCEMFMGVRRNIEAVIDYTQTDKIDVISHSMGVTIARAAILGGTVHFTDETCHLGKSLASKVDTFIGIAGANYGVCYCSNYLLMLHRACTNDAFATGICRVGNDTDEDMKINAPINCALEGVSCDNPYSSVLRQLNDRNERVADFTVSTWTTNDEIIGPTNMAWGKRTSHIPLSDLTIEYGELSHGQIKDLTAAHQLALITMHSLDAQLPHVRY